MFRKLWFNIFIRVAVIFVLTFAVIIIADRSFLLDYYTEKEKSRLLSQMDILSDTDFSDEELFMNTASDLSEKYGSRIEIYDSNDNIIYTTEAGKMFGYYKGEYNNPSFRMIRNPMETKESSVSADGSVTALVSDPFNRTEFLTCTKEIENGIFAELSVQMLLIENSSSVAESFIINIVAVCTLAALVWIFIFARKFSRPIIEMTEITDDMAHLNFSRRVNIKASGEIKKLSSSVNNMADSLSSALSDLEKANEQLKKDIEEKKRQEKMTKEFIADLSHELKTPLSIIGGYAEGLKSELPAEKKEKYCDVIIDESRRMNSLVLRLLKLSRYESGKITAEKKVFDLKAAVDTLSERMFDGTSLSFLNLIPEKTEVLSDPALFEQVLKSYLENAVKHTPENGKVTVSVTEEGEFYRISVFNSGSAIKEEEKELIWQSFYRGDTSHKRDEDRFGLGLSIVKAISVILGTECGGYNTEDGVCFWFRLAKSDS